MEPSKVENVIPQPPLSGTIEQWEAYYKQKLKQLQSDTPKPGTKYDSDKLPLDLLDPSALEGLSLVLQFGAKKYAAHNWRGGISYSRLIAALMRHTFAILRGEDKDPESGLPHIDHVGCCWMFLSNMMKTRKDMDDRHKSHVQPVTGDTHESTTFHKEKPSEVTLLDTTEQTTLANANKSLGF